MATPSTPRRLEGRVAIELPSEYAIEIGKELEQPHVVLVDDIAQEETAVKVAALAHATFGRIDILVNNAAVHHTADLDELTGDEIHRILGMTKAGVL